MRSGYLYNKNGVKIIIDKKKESYESEQIYMQYKNKKVGIDSVPGLLYVTEDYIQKAVLDMAIVDKNR